MKLIERKDYLDKLKECKGSPDIKVITGIRRCGKSILLSQYMDFLKKNFRNINLIYIDLQQLDFSDLLECNALYKYCIDHFKKI